MAVIVFAAGLHTGGGAVLLNSLLSSVNSPATVFLDSRFSFTVNKADNFTFHRVKPSVFHRLRAEFLLWKTAKEGDTILCLSNLPPLLKTSSRVFVFVQNSLIFRKNFIHSNMLVRFKARLQFFLLRSFLRDATVIVQSFSMKKLVKYQLGVDAVLCSFIPIYNLCFDNDADSIKYDYIYPASSHSHKNHKLLVKAWIILAAKGHRPSLCLTLHPDKSYELLKWIDEKKSVFNLNIYNKHVPFDQMPALYRSSSCLIYPSLTESFGLPLVEARLFDISVVAAELDYVRDVLDPDETFDPTSAVSIARALERHDGIQRQDLVLQDIESFFDMVK